MRRNCSRVKGRGKLADFSSSAYAFRFADVVEKKRVKKIFLSCGKLTRFSADEAGLFVVPKSLKIKRIKKSLRNVKIFLDKILLCDMLSLVEKCAPIQIGAFRILGPSHSLLQLARTENKELIFRHLEAERYSVLSGRNRNLNPSC
jgi:hypothetical protein